jgi:riboflavin kinase/FMN adenylyltransferase
MTIHGWQDILAHAPPFDRPVRLTIGVFDGLHIGHRRLIEGIVKGDEPGGKGPGTDALSLVITFRRSPALVLAPQSFPGFILSHEQKLSRLAELGVGAVVVIDFSDEMGNLSGRAFIELLRRNLTIQKIVVGYNFRFGKSRDTGNDELKEILAGTGIELQVTEPVMRGDSIVSSSRIRSSIQDGDFAEAHAMLLAAYALDLRGVPVRPSGPGRLLIRRRDLPQCLPRAGEYRVVCAGSSGEKRGTLRVAAESVVIASESRGDCTTIAFSESQ